MDNTVGSSGTIFKALARNSAAPRHGGRVDPAPFPAPRFASRHPVTALSTPAGRTVVDHARTTWRAIPCCWDGRWGFCLPNTATARAPSRSTKPLSISKRGVLAAWDWLDSIHRIDHAARIAASALPLLSLDMRWTPRDQHSADRRWRLSTVGRARAGQVWTADASRLNSRYRQLMGPNMATINCEPKAIRQRRHRGLGSVVERRHVPPAS